jgi:hypothetical protein
VLTFILVGLLELIFRNIRTGCLADIETFKLEMFEGEDKPKNLRTKYNYVEFCLNVNHLNIILLFYKQFSNLSPFLRIPLPTPICVIDT